MTKKKRSAKTGSVVNSKHADGFINLTARLGQGADNLQSRGTYAFDELTKNRVKLEAMYRGSWITGVAVDAIAEDMTREGIEITGTILPDRVQEIGTQMTRKGIWTSITDGIKWGRLYGGAVVVMDIDGQDPESSLDISRISKGAFIGLKVYDRWSITADMTNFVQSGRDHGLPAYYTVISNLQTGELSNVKYHHSRVIRFTGVKLPAFQAITEEMWGESIIERIYDRLVSFDTATAGAASLVQKAHIRTVQVDKLREVLSAGGQAEENITKMFQLMRLVQNMEGITLLDANDTFATNSYNFAGIPDIILQFAQQVCGALNPPTPVQRIFGQVIGGLNSGNDDLRTYYDGIKAKNEAELREGLHRILLVLHKSMYGEDAPLDFDFNFIPLWQMSQAEKADAANTTTTAVSTAYEKGIIDQTTALQELRQSSEITGVFSNITDEQIDESKIEPPPDPEIPADSEDIGEVSDKSVSMFSKIKRWLGG